MLPEELHQFTQILHSDKTTNTMGGPNVWD